jgi:hypothetical protein
MIALRPMVGSGLGKWLRMEWGTVARHSAIENGKKMGGKKMVLRT